MEAEVVFDLKDSLCSDIEGSNWFIHILAEGLSQPESLLQPGFSELSFNWVLGHIVTRRDTALRVLGVEPVWGEAESALYRSGSPPLKNGSPALPLSRLLGDLDASKDRLVTKLGSMTEAELQEAVETDRGLKPRWEHLNGLHWHETIHVGHLDLLRDLILSKRPETG
jgi:hypothetical protein